MFLIAAVLIADGLFEQFLIHTAVLWVEHSQQRSVMDTSLSDNNLYNWGTWYQPFLSVCVGCRGAFRHFRAVLDLYCCVMG